MESKLEDVLQLLCSHTKLGRDKGFLALKCLLSNVSQSDLCIDQMEKMVIDFLENVTSNNTWEEFHGHFQIGKLIIESELFSKDFADKFLSYSLKNLEHYEFRIRIIVGETLGRMCANVSTILYKKCESVLMTSIKIHLKRHDSVDEGSKDAEEIFHDTAGWKSLETSMKALQEVILGCGSEFVNFVNKELLDLIFESLEHTNRFVRETAYYLCASIARFGVSSNKKCDQVMVDSLCKYLHNGLADNWSQVRLAASVATRQFFQDLNQTDKQRHFKTLLPPMCLNRYYLAEGVKLYNQESWRLILGNEGKSNVEMFIDEVVSFYISQTKCDNHAVREAACHCMAELGLKIEKDVVRPYISELLDSLLVCFEDDSWPVRDTACVACGNFVKSFPDECKRVIDKLYPLFFTNLGDPIPSVRQGAAVAITNVARAYGEDTIEFIFTKININLKGIEFQKSASERYEGLEKGNTTYGVVKKLHDNDLALHTNQVMFSCGSLAPKMKRGGGCMDHSFKRDSEPWELADGCVYLLGELAGYEKVQNHVFNSMPNLIEATKLKHYAHHAHFFESVNRVIPNLANGLGKRLFKQHVEGFFDIIFYCISSENTLAKAAAIDCINFLSNYLGPNILKGRIEQYNMSYVHILKGII